MRLFFVDYENTGPSGVRSSGKLNSNDELFLFYTSNSCNINFELFSELNGLGSRLQLFSVTAGKNSLDFQLSSFLGFSIATNPHAEFYIVSKDKGYENVVKFWKSRQKKVFLVNDIHPNTAVTILDTLEDISACKENCQQIADILGKCKSKQDVNNALVKAFGSEKAGKIYKSIKPHLCKIGIK